MAQANPGEQDPSTQTGTRSHQNLGGQPQAKPIEEKHLADEATGRPEPSANPERAPQHQPGFEAKHQKEAGQGRSQQAPQAGLAGRRGHRQEPSQRRPRRPRGAEGPAAPSRSASRTAKHRQAKANRRNAPEAAEGMAKSSQRNK